MKVLDRLIASWGARPSSPLAFLGMATRAFGHDPKHQLPNPSIAMRRASSAARDIHRGPGNG